MSSLSSAYCAKVECLFQSDTGYVMDFSNAKFQQFILQTIGLDIYNADGYTDYCSKMNKLKQIIREKSDGDVGKLLGALLQYRELYIQRNAESDVTIRDPHAKTAKQLKALAQSMQSGKNVILSFDDRMCEARDFLSSLIEIGSRLCSNATYTYSKREDEFNDYFRDMLRSSGYVETHDQTRHGFSSKGGQSGEVDLLVARNSREIGIIEGLKLDSVNHSYISNHIKKAIEHYNALGTATYILAYVGARDFQEFWVRYTDYIKAYQFSLNVKQEFSILDAPNAAIRGGEMVLSRDDYDFPVFFIAFKMKK